MPAKIYFYILILCEIWSLRITGTFADENIRESSNFHPRQKRVVNYVPSEDVTMSIQRVPHIVIIRQNGRKKCVGSILSHHVVITIAQCVPVGTAEFQILSGTSRIDRGTFHNVIDINRYVDHNPTRPEDGLALLTVNPPFVYGTNTSFIPIHSEPLIQGTLGVISGWGYNFRCNDRGTSIPLSLRSIQVPIVAHRDCVNRYRPHNIEITDKDVCTYHPQRHCGHTDGGAPLVVEGHLVGVHLFTGPMKTQTDRQYPEVFALLQDSAYYQWIMRTIRAIEAQWNHHK